MGGEYLRELALNSGIDGHLWEFKLPPIIPGEDKPTQSWIKSLNEAVAYLKTKGPLIILGHSAGGMLALASDEAKNAANALVIIASCPNNSWSDEGDKLVKEMPLLEAARAEEQFNNTHSDEDFKSLFLEWAPYYFPQSSLKDGRKLLENNSYSGQHFVAGADFFATHNSFALPSNKVISLIHGALDRITPSRLFEPFIKQMPLVELINIEGAGHFPWIENPPLVYSCLLKAQKYALI